MFYGISQGILFVFLIIMALFYEPLYNIMFRGVETIDFSSMKFIMISCIVLYCLLGFVLIFLGKNKLNKGINID